MKKHILAFLLLFILISHTYSLDTPDIKWLLQQGVKNNISLIPDFMQSDDTPPQFKATERYIPRYEAGQGSVSVGAGVIFPLFFQQLTGEIASANLSVGGHMWFEWDIYIWKGLSTGMEISGMFALTKNSRTLFMAPITGHIKYTFQVYPVEFPVSFAMGVSMASLENLFHADLILKPKVGATYRINQNWSLGLYTSYWFIFQDYTYAENLGPEYSRFGNFIDTTVGFSYVF